MLIGIDGNEANVKNRVGSNIYAYEVIKHLYKYQISNSKYQNDISKIKNSYIIYLRDSPLTDLPNETYWWKYRVIGPKRFWTQIGLPTTLYTQKEKLDVFFTPGHYAPRFCPYPLVVSVLDTSYLTFPDYFKKSDLYQLKNWTAYSVKKAKKILTISENSKRDIVKYYKRKPEDVVVIYPGYDKARFNIKIKNQKSKIKRITQQFKIEGEYIIYVGTLQPRKNVIRLIEAYKNLKSQISNLKSEFRNSRLVIVGKRGWLYDEIFRKVKELKLENEVVFTGYVKDKDLPYLIAGAKLYVLPSLYEGFGIPVVEAMALGIPVVISRVSSLPEVAGKAAIYIENPENVESISQAIYKGLNLNEKKRNEIIKLGLSQIKKFNWEKTAEQILGVLQNIKN